MKILALHCGQAALRFQLLDAEPEELLAQGVVEKIGADSAVLRYAPQNQAPWHKVLPVKDHAAAVQLVLQALTDETAGVLQALNEIDAVGHLVVHGGERFSQAVLITPPVVAEIETCSEFAPRHNPFNLQGIAAGTRLLPAAAHAAVFDTAFHAQLPEHAFLYALPYELYERLKIRRYGFHGISHQYVSQQAARLLHRDYADFKAITCHLDQSASLAAVQNGISVDTSMGLTPLEGLIMGTRCGNIDPAIMPYLMNQEHLASQEIETLLNTASGLKGLSKMTSEMAELEEEAEGGSELHQLALEMFCYSVKKYLGAYFAALGGVDAVVFTAAIGEHSPTVRRKVCAGLECFGLSLDEQQNQQSATLISAGPTPIFVIPTNVELALARETYRLVSEKFHKRRAEQDAAQTQHMLSALTDADKARITLLWSQHQELSHVRLFELVRRELQVNLDLNAFELLLTKMGFAKHEEHNRWNH